MILLRASEAAVGYDNHVVAEDISFTVSEGDYLCIVGENGAGKTTLMRTIAGLIEPISGTIGAADEAKRRRIGYLPQQTQIQKDFPASVYEVVISGFIAAAGRSPGYTAHEKMTALSNMKRLGIDKLSGKCFRELSGGQQQRVLLARALCATDRLLLLDEPAAGLDPEAVQDMYRIIGELNSEGTAIVMITHDIDAAINNASHILMLGNNVFYGSRDEFVRRRA